MCFSLLSLSNSSSFMFIKEPNIWHKSVWNFLRLIEIFSYKLYLINYFFAFTLTSKVFLCFLLSLFSRCSFWFKVILRLFLWHKSWVKKFSVYFLHYSPNNKKDKKFSLTILKRSNVSFKMSGDFKWLWII